MDQALSPAEDPFAVWAVWVMAMAAIKTAKGKSASEEVIT